MKRNAQGVYEPVLGTGKSNGASNPKRAEAKAVPQSGLIDEAMNALGNVFLKAARRELNKRGLGGLLNV